MSLQKTITQERPVSSVSSPAQCFVFISGELNRRDLGDRPLHKGIKRAEP